MEAQPEQPIFDDAPKRLRFFVLQFLRENFHEHVAVGIVARVLSNQTLLIAGLSGNRLWVRIQPLIDRCRSREIYNMLEEIYSGLPNMSPGTQPHYVEELNQVLSDEGIGWEMDAQGHIQRLLPTAIEEEAENLFRELQATKWSTALGHLKASRKAYNSRPSRDREVCSEAFDALESVGKEVFSMPTATLGDVIKAARAKEIFAPETLAILEKIYALASNNFRHGMTQPFSLSAPEVDFVYVSCMAGILLFVRLS